MRRSDNTKDEVEAARAAGGGRERSGFTDHKCTAAVCTVVARRRYAKVLFARFALRRLSVGPRQWHPRRVVARE